MIRLAVSGPQAGRIRATASVAGVDVETEVTRLGRCHSARREIVTIHSEADALLVLQALALVAAFIGPQGRVREAAEMLATAKLIEAALAGRIAAEAA